MLQFLKLLVYFRGIMMEMIKIEVIRA